MNTSTNRNLSDNTVQFICSEFWTAEMDVEQHVVAMAGLYSVHYWHTLLIFQLKLTAVSTEDVILMYFHKW